MKRGKTLANNETGGCLVLDRISSLQEELLGRILSLLPTKEAVCTSILSRRWRRVYGWVTNLEFHDSPLCFEFDCPVKKSIFATHVDTVLRVCHSKNMTRFSLKAGEAYCYSFELESARVDRWISFPLSRTVREIDLCVHVKQPGKLPPQIFTLDKVQVLKIDSNLELENSRSFALLSLKVLYLKTPVIPDAGLLASLLSGCPSLLELDVKSSYWENSAVVRISHPFLERLSLKMPSSKLIKYPAYSELVQTEYQRTEVVLDTPKLQHLKYSDDLALRYSGGKLNGLVEADIYTSGVHEENYFESILSLLSLMTKIQSLYLSVMYLPDPEAFHQLKEKLVLLNLKDLKFDITDIRYCFVLLDLLHCFPHLERITIPMGIGSIDEDEDDDDENFDPNVCARARAELEITALIPSCLVSRLKKIVYVMYKPSEENFRLLKYFLRNAAVLQELDIACWRGDDLIQTEIALNNLPRKSVNCLIKVRLRDQ